MNTLTKKPKGEAMQSHEQKLREIAIQMILAEVRKGHTIDEAVEIIIRALIAEVNSNAD